MIKQRIPRKPWSSMSFLSQKGWSYLNYQWYILNTESLAIHQWREKKTSTLFPFSTCFIFALILSIYIFVVIFIIVNRAEWVWQGLYRRVHDWVQWYFLRSCTMQGSLNQNVSFGLFLKSEVNNYCVSYTGKDKKKYTARDLLCFHINCLYLTECGWSSLWILANTKACQVFKGKNRYFFIGRSCINCKSNFSWNSWFQIGNQVATVITLCGLADFNLTQEMTQMAIRDVNGLTILVNILRTDHVTCQVWSRVTSDDWGTN